jgi:hypothetical protein
MSLRLAQAGGAGGVLAGTRRTGLAATTGGQTLGSSSKRAMASNAFAKRHWISSRFCAMIATFERL